MEYLFLAWDLDCKHLKFFFLKKLVIYLPFSKLHIFSTDCAYRIERSIRVHLTFHFCWKSTSFSLLKKCKKALVVE